MMSIQQDARIYLSGQRGHFQRNGYRSLSTLNVGNYRAEGREPVGSLLAFNDETLLAQQSCELNAEERSIAILLPVVGGIEISSEIGEPVFVDSGETIALLLDPERPIQITNPYEDEAVNYLQIRLRERGNQMRPAEILKFDLSERNVLQTICRNQTASNILIGKFEGRAEGRLMTSNRTVFAFVIEGAFEVQNRLLEKRDALSIYVAGEIDFEALSGDAVILILLI